MNTVILVPRRDDNGYRDELWAWTKAWWEREQSHMPIIEGYHTEGLFNRSRGHQHRGTHRGRLGRGGHHRRRRDLFA